MSSKNIYSFLNKKIYIIIFLLFFSIFNYILGYARISKSIYLVNGFIFIIQILILLWLFRNHKYLKKRNKIVYKLIFLSFLLSTVILFFTKNNIYEIGIFQNKHRIILLLLVLFTIYIIKNFYKIKIIYSHKRFLFFIYLIFVLLFHSPFTRSDDTFFSRIFPFHWFRYQTIKLDNTIKLLGIVKEENKNIYNLHLSKKNIHSLEYCIDEAEKYICLPYYLVYINNNIYTMYPLIIGYLSLLSSFLMIIFHIPIQFFYNSDISYLENLLLQSFYFEKILSSFISTLTAYNLFLALRKILNHKKAIWIVFIYLFASSHLTISSQALWQHTWIEYCLSVLLYLLFKSKKHFDIFLFSVFICLLFVIRPTSILIILPLTILFLYWNKDWILQKISTKIVFYSIFPVFIVIFFLLLNYKIYGFPLGGYEYVNKILKGNLLGNFSKKYLYGLLFSINFGFFVFHPYFLFVIVYVLYFFLKRKDLKLHITILILLLPIFLYIIIYSKYSIWNGGVNYGPRMLTDILLLFFIILALIYTQIKNTVIHFIIAILSFIGLLIHLLPLTIPKTYNFFNTMCNQKVSEIYKYNSNHSIFLYSLKYYSLWIFSSIKEEPENICSYQNLEAQEIEKLKKNQNYFNNYYIILSDEVSLPYGKFCIQLKTEKVINLEDFIILFPKNIQYFVSNKNNIISINFNNSYIIKNLKYTVFIKNIQSSPLLKSITYSKGYCK